MKSEIAITDVTDMGINLACVAGVRRSDGRVVRLQDPRPQKALLRDIGGLLPGTLINVDWRPIDSAVRPHVEDGKWVPSSLVKCGQMTPGDFLSLVGGNAFLGVVEAFGAPSVVGAGGNAGFAPGTGTRSLATVRAASISFIVWPDKVRVDFQDEAGGSWGAVPFQDLAVKRHRSACPSCNSGLETALKKEFACVDVLLRVGLAREWQGACWLQVNAVCSGVRRHFL